MVGSGIGGWGYLLAREERWHVLAVHNPQLRAAVGLAGVVDEADPGHCGGGCECGAAEGWWEAEGLVGGGRVSGRQRGWWHTGIPTAEPVACGHVWNERYTVRK